MPAKKQPPKQISLNEEQREVVEAGSGCFAVIAGPGSGKSSTLTQRYAKLLKDGVPPSEILALSFTQTAARNLKERVEGQAGKLETTRTSGSRTFHSLSLAFATEERTAYPFELAESPICPEPQANKLAGEAARKYELDSRVLRPAVALWRRGRISPSKAVSDSENSLNAKQLKLALAYKKYDALLRENGVLDFDSMIFWMVELLSKSKELRSRWAYHFVMCDESQDCCITDWQLLKLLSEKHGNLLCVGDPGQSCFGFRGASPDLFLKMEDMFPGTKKLYLATNYRSSKDLVEFLKGIGPVPELATLFHTPNESGPKPVVKGFTNSIDEAKWIVSKIKESI